MPFDPREHLSTISGRDYLEVKWRLVWLREMHPEAAIRTEIIGHDPDEEWVIVKATVTLPNGGVATGLAWQKPTSIAKDYIANGETSAIGRALGALGFGTQFTRDFDQPEGQVVDSPVRKTVPRIIDATRPASYEQRQWYFTRMTKLAVPAEFHITIAEDVSSQDWADMPATVLRDIVEAVQAALLTKRDDRWVIDEPVTTVAGG
jgi:hypothetical protein